MTNYSFDAKHIVITIGKQLKKHLIGEHGDELGRISDPEVKAAVTNLSNAVSGREDMVAAIKKALCFVKDREVETAVYAAVKWLTPII